MNTRPKINTGIASIMLLASVFAGWQTMLFIGIILFAFCETEDKVRDNAVKIISFLVGFTIVSLGWDLITKCVYFIPDTISTLVGIINSVLPVLSQIHIDGLLNTIPELFSIADDLVNIVFIIVKLSFVLAVLSGKDTNKFFMSNFFSKYIAKAIHYANNSVVAHSDMVRPMEPASSAIEPTVMPAPVPPRPAPAPAPVPMPTQQQEPPIK